MNRKYFAFTGLLFLMIISSCRKDAPKTDLLTETYPNEQENIKNIVTHIFDLARAKQMDSVEAYHLYGPKFSKFDDGEYAGRMNAEDAKQAERNLFTAVSSFDYDLDDFKVDVFNDAA